ncbi:MAG: LLM class F420-dependent oxidoreductase [Acidimicrobiales bacterium]|jgi:probable F420-dependent oxidoreductase
MELGKVGIWWNIPWLVDETSLDVAAEMEALGYSALWRGGGFKPGLSTSFERLLAATTHVPVASGIVSIWQTSPEELSKAVADLDNRYPERFLLGLGTSHEAMVKNYTRPYAHMVSYLDALDTAGPVVAKDRRVLAALGPRMLKLAGERTTGAHPYFVPVEHTARARTILGPDPLLAPEVTVVLESDPTKARDLARTFTAAFLSLPDYTNNLRSLGFGDNDLAGGGSDRLIDAVVCWGDLNAIAARVREHFEAGADHVCIQVVSTSQRSFPLAEYRELAPALLAA